MITVRKSNERGNANFGWLQSKHTFSFGSYYDPKHMGFSALRVINEDIVAPAAGFDTHGHQDMEIISYVLQGSIEHKDSEGNVQTLPAGEFQLMSAGTGIRHSEYNASKDEDLRFLQIWIKPNILGQKPGYQQKDFGKKSGLTLVADPKGKEGALSIKQDASLYQLILNPGENTGLDINSDRKVYVHQVEGYLEVEQTAITPGDGAMVVDQNKLNLSNKSDTEAIALVFDLP